MTKQGKRAKVIRGVDLASEPDKTVATVTSGKGNGQLIHWEVGDRCIVTLDGDQFPGEVLKFKDDGRIRVRYDAGGAGNVKPELLTKPSVDPAEDDEDDSTESEPEMRGGKEQIGFNQYAVRWDKDNVNFKFDTGDNVHFYGAWRKSRNGSTDEIVYAIDIYAKFISAKEEHMDLAVDSVLYHYDPRDNIRSLNSDICAIANKWFHQQVKGNGQTIERLKKMAEQPTLRITKLETIDRMIMRLREFRDTAIRCGGDRLLQLESDVKGAPPINVSINVTKQAIILEGKPPTLALGAVADGLSVTNGRGKGGEGKVRSIVNVPSDANVNDLVAKLKTVTDKGEQRKLRAILRKMGHKGGSRSVK